MRSGARHVLQVVLIESALIHQTKRAVEQTALTHDNVQRFTDGVTVRKVIVVPGKLVNVVAN